MATARSRARHTLATESSAIANTSHRVDDSCCAQSPRALGRNITPINQATKYLRRRAVLEIPPVRERLAFQFGWYGTRH